MSCYPLQVVSRMVMNRSGEVFYIGGNDILPAPLSAEREAEVIEMRGTEKEKRKVGSDRAQSTARWFILQRNLIIQG